ncbi:MAG: M28 family peptidase [Acidobacteria bacterium]|nr:M28 family peptidase [Acidobacteriota bacterium]
MDTTYALGRILRSPELCRDLEAICGCGGRFAGTQSEAMARAFLEQRLGEVARTVRAHLFTYSGWTRQSSRLRLLRRAAQDLASTSLVLSPATPAGGLELEVLDLGRGTAREFRASRDRIPGRAVLVQHEYPFSVAHIHRRRKYAWAREAGAAAFLIANYIPGCGVVTGSSGRGEPADIPALGLSHEAGDVLRRESEQGSARVLLEVRVARRKATGANLIAEIPGKSDGWVVLCAHYDGHDLAESAMDNASGLAAVLEVFRAVGPSVPQFRRGLRVIFFTAEEWGLLGSHLYVQSLSDGERRRIALAINLDTVVGGASLTALTSGMSDVGDFVRQATATGGVPVTLVSPLQANSDHYNFFLGGIPSFRLVSGYENPASLTRYLLTPADTRDKVDPGELRVAAMAAAELVLRACTSAEPIAEHRRPAEVQRTLDAADP